MENLELSTDYRKRTWTDHKGRAVIICTMSNRWLTNLKKWLRNNNPNAIELKWIKEEINRRHQKLAIDINML